MPTQVPSKTGPEDELFNLVSVLYHQLKQAEVSERHIEDAQASGDEPLADFFRECQTQSKRLSEQGKALLRERIRRAAEAKHHGDTKVDESSRESFPASDAPAY